MRNTDAALHAHAWRREVENPGEPPGMHGSILACIGVQGQGGR